MPPPPEDAGDYSPHRLLRRSASGDVDAFARLYDLTSPRVYGLALRVLADPNDAERVTEESFLEVWESCAHHDPRRSSALAWVLSVGHRRAVDRARARADSRSASPSGATAVELAYLGGFTHAEIDRARHGSPGTARTEIREELLKGART